MKAGSLIILGLLLTLGCWAQSGPQTWQQTAFTNQTTDANSVVFRNISQASHSLSWCVNILPSAPFPTLELDGTNSTASSATFQPISNLALVGANGKFCGVIYAGQYYSQVKAKITGITGTGVALSATYSASTGTISPPANLGNPVTSTIATYAPLPQILVSPTVSVKSTPVSATANGTILYGASIYNPNAGVVYVAFDNVNNVVPSGAPVLIAVPATSSIVLTLPPEGIDFTGFSNLYIWASTALGSNADPASSVVVNPWYKLRLGSQSIPN